MAVPDASVAQDFYGTFGLDVEGKGSTLLLKTFGHEHRWGSVVEGAKTKALHHLSFGCYAGLQAARRDGRVERMFAVAPAVNHWSFDFMAGDTRPLTVVQGRADEIVPFSEVQDWVDTQAQVDFHAIAGAGHFFPAHMGVMTHSLLAGVGATADRASARS